MAKKVIKAKSSSKGTQLRLRGLADKVASVDKGTLRDDYPEFKAGDTLRVHVRIKEGEKERIQMFEGVCIGRSNATAGKSFTVRKVSHGVGVERIFLESSPKVAKVDVLQIGKVRRAKLYYLRGLEGKAARIERDVESNFALAQKAAAKEAKTKAKAKSKAKATTEASEQ